ncbi:hypothetical protein HZA86_02375 [Candidatus Uhrbacteria bacterium]|nr:hypothetical protein [Candidatus Uhrbacteria bacterium]
MFGEHPAIGSEAVNGQDPKIGSEQRLERDFLLNFQYQKTICQWQTDLLSPLSSESQSERIKALDGFIRQAKKTCQVEDGRCKGGWTRMMQEMVTDQRLGVVIDAVDQSKFSELIAEIPLEEGRVETIKSASLACAMSEVVNERMIFLEKLFIVTSRAIEREQVLDNEIINLWVNLFKQFSLLRAMALQERLREQIEVIQRVREETLRRLQQVYGAKLSVEAIKRVRTATISIADEYLSASAVFRGRLRPFWEAAYSANEDSPTVSVELHGLLEWSQSNIPNQLSHELCHASTGHGPQQPQQPKDPTDHIMGQRRVGLNKYRWVNEAMTERRRGKIYSLPSGELHYLTERQVVQSMIDQGAISEDTLEDWIAVEGDDTEIEQHVRTAHPLFSQYLDKIRYANPFSGQRELTQLLKEMSI